MDSVKCNTLEKVEKASTKDTGRMIDVMEKEFLFTKMVTFIQAGGDWARNMARELLLQRLQA